MLDGMRYGLESRLTIPNPGEAYDSESESRAKL
jgi:hypothetical protein